MVVERQLENNLEQSDTIYADELKIKNIYVWPKQNKKWIF